MTVYWQRYTTGTRSTSAARRSLDMVKTALAWRLIQRRTLFVLFALALTFSIPTLQFPVLADAPPRLY